MKKNRTVKKLWGHYFLSLECCSFWIFSHVHLLSSLLLTKEDCWPLSWFRKSIITHISSQKYTFLKIFVGFSGSKRCNTTFIHSRWLYKTIHQTPAVKCVSPSYVQLDVMWFLWVLIIYEKKKICCTIIW